MIFIHTSSFGCIVETRRKLGKSTSGKLVQQNYFWCVTHEKELCSCGVAFGEHFDHDQINKEEKEYRESPEYLRRILRERNATIVSKIN